MSISPLRPATYTTAAPSYAALRPIKGVGPAFPVFKALVPDLLRVGTSQYDPTAAYVCAVAAAWAYSDPVTLSTALARLGLEENTCRYFGVENDALFVVSNAFLVQSACGKVVILCYRGTEPRNFISWLTDANIHPLSVQFKFHDSDVLGEVHGGFYRNVRATWYDVVTGLRQASLGRSVGVEAREGLAPFEALYVCGHSLGAAMAALAAVKLASDPSYADFAKHLRGVYTFGQPMIGKPQFVRECERLPLLRNGVFRHVFDHDIVPRLPPKVSGEFASFGIEYRSAPRKGPESASRRKGWVQSEAPVKQVLEPLLSNLIGIGAFIAQQFPALARLPLAYSWDHHSPNYYLECTQPDGVRSEFEV